MTRCENTSSGVGEGGFIISIFFSNVLLGRGCIDNLQFVQVHVGCLVYSIALWVDFTLSCKCIYYPATSRLFDWGLEFLFSVTYNAVRPSHSHGENRVIFDENNTITPAHKKEH